MTQLTDLQVLRAYKNKLTAVSPFIFHLPQLKVVMLSDNEIQSIPADIAHRKATLRTFNVARNKLRSLPLELGALESVTSFCIEENPYEEPYSVWLKRVVEEQAEQPFNASTSYLPIIQSFQDTPREWPVVYRAASNGDYVGLKALKKRV